MSSIFLQFTGYLNTPKLWEGTNSFGLTQFDFEGPQVKTYPYNLDRNLRLGKRVERFVSYELQQQPDIKIIAENIQILHQKQTLGELDCLLKQNNQNIHLEIVYKFYLYDKNVGTTESEHWIGPNRRDSLVEKLSKLKEKQLPLLLNPETLPYLETLGIASTNIKQYVYFKAQLFVPADMKNNYFPEVNNSCIAGFYLHYSELESLKHCKFHLPHKIDWLQNIQIQTPWLSYSEFRTRIAPILNQQSSPLCWVKYPNGETEKCFIVWWH
ncbi:DUF1853 family protein [Formosa sp. S-31]|uniref:DUF1853 family protein n=1 Tax=Formosa sp. S-31 TaxID=2790949 RepID=UPI003EBA8CDB